MKAKLIFDLPEETHEWRNAIDGCKMRSVLWETREKITDKLRSDGLTNKETKLIRELLDQFLEILQDHNIDLDA